MNIEEERKAFIDLCKNQFGNAYYPMNDDWSEGEFCDPVVQRHFVTWLAAKAHAEEMAKAEAEALKPTVKVQHLTRDCNYPYMLVQYQGEKVLGRVDYFESTEAAKLWAESNGYRVIE